MATKSSKALTGKALQLAVLRFIAREEPLGATLSAFPQLDRVKLQKALERIAGVLRVVGPTVSAPPAAHYVSAPPRPNVTTAPKSWAEQTQPAPIRIAPPSNNRHVIIGLGVGSILMATLAVGMGIYLPVSLVLPTVVGTVIGHVWNKMALRTSSPEYTVRLGVLLATGLVVGDSLMGLAYAGAVGALGDPDRLAVVPESFAPAAGWIAVVALVVLTVGVYARTKALATRAA